MLEALPQQLLNGLSVGMAYGLVALGLTLVFGVLHIVNFAHGEFYMLGALAAVIVCQYLGIPYAFAILAAAAAVAAVSWIVDMAVVEPFLDKSDGLSSVLLATYGIHLLLLHGVLSTWGPNPHRVDGLEGSMQVADLVLSNQRLLVLAAGLALVIGLEFLIRRTQFGRELRALAQDAFAARVVGIKVGEIRAKTFVIAAILAGVAGALLVPITLFTPFLGQQVIIKAFVVVVIGGMGNIAGAILCGIALGILESVLGTFMESGFSLALIYSLLVVVLLFRPNGLFGAAKH